MTLDEAIIHAEEVVSIKKEESIDAELQGCDRYSMKCEKCSTEHRQLADWLKELKAFRQAKTKILKAIEELREDAKYHAYPIQDNTEMVIFGAEMALNIIDNKHN